MKKLIEIEGEKDDILLFIKKVHNLYLETQFNNAFVIRFHVKGITLGEHNRISKSAKKEIFSLLQPLIFYKNEGRYRYLRRKHLEGFRRQLVRG